MITGETPSFYSPGTFGNASPSPSRIPVRFYWWISNVDGLLCLLPSGVPPRAHRCPTTPHPHGSLLLDIVDMAFTTPTFPVRALYPPHLPTDIYRAFCPPRAPVLGCRTPFTGAGLPTFLQPVATCLPAIRRRWRSPLVGVQTYSSFRAFLPDASYCGSGWLFHSHCQRACPPPPCPHPHPFRAAPRPLLQAVGYDCAA